MKRYLIPILANFALTTSVSANIDARINEICMNAADYKGCVELNTKKYSLPKCNFFLKTKCIGEIEFTNGKYLGEKSNEKAHGFGTFYWSDGDRYVGQWVYGKRSGRGTFYWAAGDIYDGQFKNGIRTGQGTYIWPSGNRYVGQFKDGDFHGQGTLFYKSGGSWSGEWRNDKKTENGSYTKSPEEKAFENQLILDMMRQQQQNSNDLYRSIMGW